MMTNDIDLELISTLIWLTWVINDRGHKGYLIMGISFVYVMQWKEKDSPHWIIEIQWFTFLSLMSSKQPRDL